MPQHPAYSEKKLNEAHKQKLLDGGISEEIIAEAGVFSVTSPEEIRRLTGVPVREGGGTAFPYPGETDFVRVRLDVPQPDPQREEKKMKYVSPVGAGCRLYVPPRADIEAKTVIITEGEKKALAAVSRGLNCFGVAGIDAWRERGLLGEKLPPMEALLPRLKRNWSGQKIILVYDSDIDQHHDRWEAFPTLAEVLYSLGADEVKIVTLPKPEDLDLPKELKKKFEKIGLDDFFVAVEAVGGDAVEEFWKIVNRQNPWVPMMFKKASEKYVEKILQTHSVNNIEDIEGILNSAVSVYLTKGKLGIRALFQSLGLKKTEIQGLLGEVKERAQKVKESQNKTLNRKHSKQKSKNENKESPGERENKETLFNTPQRYIADVFPPAAEVLPPNFPFPETGDEDSFYDIQDEKVVLVSESTNIDAKTGEESKKERISPVINTVILLVKRVDPIERDTGIEKWSIAWRERQKWRFADVPARYLFDRKRVGELVDTGLPVASSNIDKLIKWLDGLRALAVLGHDNAPELPTVRAVSRCGWHTLNNESFFVFGNKIIRPNSDNDLELADAGDREEIQQDSGSNTDADIRWAEDLSAMERQILASFQCKGDPETHKKFLIDSAKKHPAIAFGLGCAVGAPLIRYAQNAGLIDVAGFTVAMVPRVGGRSRHQGKTVWSQVIASLYGFPECDERGRLRFADNTRTATQVLFSTCCDLTIHLEDVHKLARRIKKSAAEEIDYILHLAAQGMERGRGARSGGGRRTRSFKVVVFWTSEVDVTVMLPTESGAHDRVLKLPPLLPEESAANRDEANRLREMAMNNYGYAGQEYLIWLVKQIAEKGSNFILEAIKIAIKHLYQKLPTDSRWGSASRLASRAAVGFAGLMLAMDAWGADDSNIAAVGQKFLEGWEMVLEGISPETVAERALDAVQAYIVANKELIEGLRDPEANPPQKWVGAKTSVMSNSGRKVEVIALTEPAFADAVGQEPYELDAHHALQALAGAGHVVTRTERKSDGKMTTRTKIGVRIGGVFVRCICILLEKVFSPDSSEMESEENYSF